jgi:hypothetical protein
MIRESKPRKGYDANILKLFIRKLFSAILVLFLFSIAFFAMNQWVISVSTPTPRPTPDRRRTATPVDFIPFSGDIKRTIEEIYIPVDRGCTVIDYLGKTDVTGNIDLLDVTSDGRPDNSAVKEIADSVYHTYRAYLADFQYPVKYIFIEQRREGIIYELTWTSQSPNYYLRHLSWIGDQILVFEKSYGGRYDEIIGIDVERLEFVYYAGFGYCH